MITLKLKDEVRHLLDDYSDEVREAVFDCVEEVANETAQKLKDTSPRITGKYAKGWKSDIQKNRLNGIKAVVHNKDHAERAHLLENGHVSSNGTGRTFGFVPAHPHIKPVNDWAQEELAKRIEERLG